MHRFYCPQINVQSDRVVITNSKELHHLRHVLRLKKGDVIQVFNQKGEEATGAILASHPRQVTVAVESVRTYSPQPPWIILACAMPKKSKFEMIIEKATELGVDEIIPMKTERTQVQLKADRRDAKIARYQEVAVNAAKQSRRLSVPVIHPAMDFSSILKQFHDGEQTRIFIPSLVGERKNILEALRSVSSPSRIAFLIGPEGDFTAQEYASARTHGCIPVSLGENVLKVETAALTAVACAQLHYRHA